MSYPVFGQPNFLTVVGLLIHDILSVEPKDLPAFQVFLLFDELFLQVMITDNFGDRLFLTVKILD
jgi:hypothetical protein